VDLEIGYKHPLLDRFHATLDYYLSSVTYYEVTDASFYDNNISLKFDMDMFDEKARCAFNNTVEYNYYPNEEISTYISYNPQLSIKHNFNDAAFQRLSYDFAVREYSDRKAEDGAGLKRDSDRQDLRHGVTYELASLFFKDIFIKIKNQYFVNDSNDQFMDYYDYWSYRANLSAILPLFGDRLYGLIGVGYQRIDYDTRYLVDDRDKTEKDDLYDISSSLLFDITERLSASLNYAYRQNNSNEPSEEYSGSIISVGFHYAF
jgi:hypothetical protein